jgi:hypothetical protein
MYETGVHPTLWTIVKDFYDALTSKIKWCGDISESFPIKQGVRQVGVLSTFLYKVYNNALLQDLQNQKLGFMIGRTYVGCPTCADDIALLSNNVNELHDMLLTLHRYSRQDRVSIHPTKTKAVILNKTSKIPKTNSKWQLGDTEISPTNHAIHLGIPRAETRENEANIKDRISLARKTMYALMNTGLHGSNGINPSVALRIYEAYVLPKLVYGMEVLSLNQKQLGILSKFHIDNPRKFQSLPIRTATTVIYLLIGAMPIKAEIHKRQLGFLHNILN